MDCNIFICFRFFYSHKFQAPAFSKWDKCSDPLSRNSFLLFTLTSMLHYNCKKIKLKVMAMKTAKTYSIAELAEEFGITTRAIRYYEELGLLKPERTEAGQRIFSSKERGRLKLIFRGKRYGFQLDEIREMIQLFDLDRTGRKQLERTIEYGKGKIEEVTERIEELLRIRSEMEQLLEEFQTKLNELEREKNEYP